MTDRALTTRDVSALASFARRIPEMSMVSTERIERNLAVMDAHRFTTGQRTLTALALMALVRYAERAPSSDFTDAEYDRRDDLTRRARHMLDTTTLEIAS